MGLRVILDGQNVEIITLYSFYGIVVGIELGDFNISPLH